MYAFFAATPLQVINSVAIKEGLFQNEKADLFLLTFASDMSALKEKLTKTNVFNRIIFLNEPLGKKNEKTNKLKSFINPSKETLALLTKNKYSQMFSSRIGIANDFIYTILLKENPLLSFNYYEEGVGDYFCASMRPNSKTTKLLSLFGYKNPFLSLKNQYVYHPELLLANTEFNTVRIPSLRENNNILREVFLDENFVFPKSIRLLYLDQPFWEQQGIFVDHSGFLEQISQSIPKENIYVKLHPTRNHEDNFYMDLGFKIFPKTTMPWEAIVDEKIREDIILCAVSSTAIVTPKTMFDKEIKSLLLFDMAKDFEPINKEEQRRYFTSVKNLYNKENTFFMPKTAQELQNALSKLCNNERND